MTALAQACGAMPVSAGLWLRLPVEGDAPELQALIEANRAYLARWLPWAEGQTLADSEDFIARCEDQLLGNDGFQAAAVRDGSIVGMVGFTGVDWERRSTGIGYWLAAEQQGRGIVTAAVRRLVEHAFAVWGLERVEVRAAVENRRSRAVAERLGFAQEEILPEAEQVGERCLDLVVYAMGAADWLSGARGSAGPSAPR